MSDKAWEAISDIPRDPAGFADFRALFNKGWEAGWQARDEQHAAELEELQIELDAERLWIKEGKKLHQVQKEMLAAKDAEIERLREALAERDERIAKLEGHLDWIGWSSEGIEKAQAELAAKDERICLYEDCVGANDPCTCYACKGDEIARQTAEIERLREALEKCESLTQLSPDTIQEVGERVGAIVRKALGKASSAEYWREVMRRDDL